MKRAIVVRTVKSFHHQVTTLDRAKLTRRLGTLRPDALAGVEGGLRTALDLD